MPDAHVFLLLESLTFVAFRTRFLRALTASLKDGSPRLHLVNLDILDEHLRSRAALHASFGAVGRGDGDRDELVERELTLLPSYVSFRDFLDYWPGVSGSCAQLLLLDSPLALLQHSPFHAYAGRVRPAPPHSFLGQSERSEAATSTQSGATSSKLKAQFAPLNEYLLFTEVPSNTEFPPNRTFTRFTTIQRDCSQVRVERSAGWASRVGGKVVAVAAGGTVSRPERGACALCGSRSATVTARNRRDPRNLCRRAALRHAAKRADHAALCHCSIRQLSARSCSNAK